MAGAGAGQGAEDRPAQADLHRRPDARLRPGRGALGLTQVTALGLVAPGADRGALRDLLEAHVGRTYGRLTRVCPHCGSVEHGRPRIADHPGLHVSAAYAAGLALLATGPVPLGVDVETDGPAPDGFADRAAWTRAEAALKLTGTGLRTDPWAPPPDGVRFSSITGLPEGYVAALASWEGDGPASIALTLGSP